MRAGPVKWTYEAHFFGSNLPPRPSPLTEGIPRFGMVIWSEFLSVEVLHEQGREWVVQGIPCDAKRARKQACCGGSPDDTPIEVRHFLVPGHDRQIVDSCCGYNGSICRISVFPVEHHVLGPHCRRNRHDFQLLDRLQPSDVFTNIDSPEVKIFEPPFDAYLPYTDGTDGDPLRGCSFTRFFCSIREPVRLQSPPKERAGIKKDQSTPHSSVSGASAWSSEKRAFPLKSEKTSSTDLVSFSLTTFRTGLRWLVTISSSPVSSTRRKKSSIWAFNSLFDTAIIGAIPSDYDHGHAYGLYCRMPLLEGLCQQDPFRPQRSLRHLTLHFSNSRSACFFREARLRVG